MSMSYCTQCGHALAGDEKFCPACGTAVKQATAPALKKTESQSIQPIFSKKILNVKDYFEGKNVNFHNKLNVSCCSRFIYLPLLPKMYYLFMLADGTCTKAEMQKFNALCKSLDITKEDRTAAIVYCEGNIPDNSPHHTADIMNELKKLLEKQQQNCFTRTAMHDHPDDLHPIFLAILWNLIDLGYADTVLNQEEKDFIETLAKAWKISQDSLNELYDTAETIQALCRKISWIRQSELPTTEKKEAERKASNQIINQYKSVRALMTEAVRI